ncbi:ATP-dependent endonuclease, partial [Chloroflexota bacterium]
MLEQLELINFRCFEHCTVEFEKFNLFVGKNNTGKSTLVDALKLVSNVLRYAQYRDGYLEDRDIPFSLTNLRHDYNEDETIVRAKFSDNFEVTIEFPFGDRPNSFFSINDETVSKANLQLLDKTVVGIIPPVGTFEAVERPGNKKYVQSIMISHLTPRHFRNIWHYFDEEFQQFQELLEKTWPGCVIERPEYNSSINELYMFFKENNITREIFWSGHGFQVWLQLMTFLIKLGRTETLILDEPDIYLHSDMQKKLVAICRERSNQTIIATHAVDIIEEVEPDDIICIDKETNTPKRLSSIDEVQTIVNELGSSQNLKLVHFYRGKTCLFVEGKDFSYLKILAKTLNAEKFMREEGFTVVPLDGFSNWDRLMHINWIMRNALGEDVKCYVILDSDYKRYGLL